MKIIYKIWAQTLIPQKNETLIIFEPIGKSQRIVRTAKELANDQLLLSGFSPVESSLISLIAKMDRSV